ncbi:MAG: YgcG family protein [Bryobacteraceae bacterium]
MTRWLRWCGALACAAAAAWAVDWKALQPQGYVSDFAGVIDAGAKAQLERYCAAVERAAGSQIALVTIPSLQGEPIEDVANTIFRAWGVGRKGENNGIMLLLSTGDRRSRLEVGYGLEPYIPDGFAGSILREMRPDLRAGDYSAALIAAARTIGGRIAQAKGVNLETPPPRAPARERPVSTPWPLLIGGILLFLFLARAGRRPYAYGGWGGFLSGLILGNMMGGGAWRARGGGGFGGFDSGDGFGGFGGGDSGGGGASSDW